MICSVPHGPRQATASQAIDSVTLSCGHMARLAWQGAPARQQPHLQELLILLRVCMYVSQDLDGNLLPAVAALVQVPKRPGRNLVLEGYVCWIELPVVGGRCCC